ncbi:MAG: hypothetical protein QXL35_00790 [Candidatus Bathyarchaeia archaeon]
MGDRALMALSGSPWIRLRRKVCTTSSRLCARANLSAPKIPARWFKALRLSGPQ